MKKKIILLILPVLFTVNLYSQSKIWDFANPSATWPLNFGGVSSPTIIDNLALIPGTNITNLGEIDSNSTSWADGFSGTQRLKLNGAGLNLGITPEIDNIYIPTKRYLYFAVNGSCSVKIWFRGGGSGDRTLYITDGSSVVGKFPTTNSDQQIYTFNYTGGATNLYIFSLNKAHNLYKIEVSPSSALNTTTLSLNSKSSVVPTKVYALGNRIYTSNVKTTSEINIYSITGALVKAFKTNEDINFTVKPGLYFANIKTPEGQKSVKLLAI
ncbi:T9SS type A sorting domain-containing protein [Seonamhaeicola sp. NFXS20]|uniref:T9SS type A sorting domain-containing protein n=1 Tax=Seonamhaeicola sp. NFXS20 TaxID=2816959 RepID=UPI003B8D7E34